MVDNKEWTRNNSDGETITIGMAEIMNTRTCTLRDRTIVVWIMPRHPRPAKDTNGVIYPPILLLSYVGADTAL